MSSNPSDFNAIGFSRQIRRTVELKGGLMRQIAMMATGDLYHEDGRYPRITGGGLPTKITTRAPVTPNSEADYSNRKVVRYDYHDATINMDRQDLDRVVADPRSEKTDILLQKFRRQEDLVYQQSALGDAAGGDAGATTVNFTSGNIIDVTLGHAAGVTNAGWTYEKQVAAIEKFGTNLVDLGRYKPTFVISWTQWADMTQDDHYINRDYTDRKPTYGNGIYVPDYMGCAFIVYEIVPYMNTAVTGFRIADSDISSAGGWTDTDTTDIRACIATVKDSTLLEIKPDIMTRASENPQLSYRMQVYMEYGIGGVRMEEEKVLAIPCDQSPAAA